MNTHFGLCSIQVAIELRVANGAIATGALNDESQANSRDLLTGSADLGREAGRQCELDRSPDSTSLAAATPKTMCASSEMWRFPWGKWSSATPL